MIRTIAIVFASILLVSCGTQNIDTACTAFEPIDYSALADSSETVTQVRRHNSAWLALCRP